MNNDVVTAYVYDTLDKNKLIGTIKVPRGSELLVGQTYIKPADGLYGTCLLYTSPSPRDS